MEGHPGWGQPAAPTPPLSPIGTLPLRSSAKSAPAASLRCRDPPPQSPPPHAPPSLLSWVKVFQSSWESFCFFSTTSFPPSTSTLSVYFCDLPILVRSPRVTSSFTCDGTPGRCRNTPPGGPFKRGERGSGLTSKVCTGMLLALRERGWGGAAGVAELISCRAFSAWQSRRQRRQSAGHRDPQPPQPHQNPSPPTPPTHGVPSVPPEWLVLAPAPTGLRPDHTLAQAWHRPPRRDPRPHLLLDAGEEILQH